MYVVPRMAQYVGITMTKRFKIGGCVLSAMLAGTKAQALNTDWTGFYVGGKAGATIEHFELQTSLQPNAIFTPAEVNVINQAGAQSLHSIGFLSGIEGGYNWRFKRFLLGLETDIQALSNSGETNSAALPYPDGSANQFLVSSYANNNWLWTLRPRLGWVSPFGVIYATGGLGLTWLQSDFMLSSSALGFESEQVNTVKAGYVVGGGIETPITEDLSIKAEYLYEQYPQTQAYLMNQLIPLGQSMSNSVDLAGSFITVGLNYHFNQTLPQWFQAAEFWNAQQWETEIGARVFISSGTVGAPQPLLNSSPDGDLLASRLIFSNLTGVSEELYARADHASGVFIKGFLGPGTITGGQLNDEDFPAIDAYSNTLSQIQGNLAYGVIDLGYSFLKNQTAKTGFFVGYDYNAQTLKAYNCRQLAGDVVCQNPNELTNFLALSEADTYNSLRIGLASQYAVTNELTLTPEVAYIPVVNLNGLDIHNARQLHGPEQSSQGDGTMVEASLDYHLNDLWSVGLGGRYWAWNMHTGSVEFDFVGNPEVISEPARFNTTRYGGFLQINYRHREHPTFDLNTNGQHWQGVFLGGNIGGAWGNSEWSDPFGATPGAPDYINTPGFGDHIASSGPLGGGNLAFNWQTANWVYGVAGSLAATDIRGENTLFSGLGGINGQTKINYLGTLVGRLGHVLYDSLLYINAGTNVVNTQFTLNANTSEYLWGSETQTQSNWGWTIGAGLEYAFNDRWSSTVEYNYLGLPSQAVAFPNVQIINDDTITANQSVNLVKLSVNYKLGELN